MEENSHDNSVPTLKQLRESVGLTQAQLADKLRLSLSVVQKWEQGRRTPTIDNAAILARELKVSLKTLYKAFRIDVSDLPDDSTR